jgi:hypothetical protein
MRLLLALTVIFVSSAAIAEDLLVYPVSIPQECVQLAQREGVPVILKNERQARHARAKLAQLDDGDPSVRECRQAVRRAMAQYGQ